MPDFPLPLFRVWFCVPLLAFLAGCGGDGDGATVQGSVTFDGQPVEKGYINFFPADGKGRPAGGEINGGKFTVKGVTVGKNRVEVTAAPPGPVHDNMGDAIKAAKAKKGPAPDAIAPNAEGNGQVHDVAAGTELNLTLRPRAGSDGKRQ